MSWFTRPVRASHATAASMSSGPARTCVPSYRPAPPFNLQRRKPKRANNLHAEWHEHLLGRRPGAGRAERAGAGRRAEAALARPGVSPSPAPDGEGGGGTRSRPSRLGRGCAVAEPEGPAPASSQLGEFADALEDQKRGGKKKAKE